MTHEWKIPHDCAMVCLCIPLDIAFYLHLPAMKISQSLFFLNRPHRASVSFRYGGAKKSRPITDIVSGEPFINLFTKKLFVSIYDYVLIRVSVSLLFTLPRRPTQ